LVSQMRKQGRSGSIVTLICDDGNRYQDSYYKPEWLQANGFDISPWVERYRRFFNEGQW
ncbi:PLP-dependent cysteine synthase family protein, partial [Pseudomonas sp. MWU13-2860]